MPTSAMPTNDRLCLQVSAAPHTERQFLAHPARVDEDRGFTLVEIMIVLFLIGLLSAAVIVSLPDPRGSLVSEAERFAARAAAARNEAVISARAIRVIVDRQGYRFETRRRGRWTNLDDKPLRPTRWHEETVSDQAIFLFDSTGVVEEPHRLRIVRGADQISVLLDQDGNVRVTG